MELDYLAILNATVAQFIIGAIWYMPLFGNLWGKIHGMDKVSKDDRKKMMKSMGPMLALQFLVTFVTTFVLAIFITYQPSWNAYGIAAFMWIGFVVPTQVSGVIFGGTKPEWIVPKILVQAGCSLVCLEVAAAIILAML